MNVEKLEDRMMLMKPQELQQFAAMHKNDPYILPLAMRVADMRKKLQVAQGLQYAGQQPPTVADRDLQKMLLPEDQGIGTLPAQNIAKMADGGIAGYSAGGNAKSDIAEENQKYRTYAMQKALEMQLDPSFVDAIFYNESRYDPNAKSARGPTGIGQLTRDTAARYGLKPEDRKDPYKNIDASLLFIKDLFNKYNDRAKVAVGYNQGERVLDEHLKQNQGKLVPENLPANVVTEDKQEPIRYLKKVLEYVPVSSAAAGEVKPAVAAAPSKQGTATQEIKAFGGSAANLADTLWNLFPGTAATLLHPVYRAFGASPETARLWSYGAASDLSNPFGKAFGIENLPEYKGAPTAQLMDWISKHLNESAESISNKTRIPVQDVQNMQDMLLLGAPGAAKGAVKPVVGATKRGKGTGIDSLVSSEELAARKNAADVAAAAADKRKKEQAWQKQNLKQGELFNEQEAPVPTDAAAKKAAADAEARAAEAKAKAEADVSGQGLNLELFNRRQAPIPKNKLIDDPLLAELDKQQKAREAANAEVEGVKEGVSNARILEANREAIRTRERVANAAREVARAEAASKAGIKPSPTALYPKFGGIANIIPGAIAGAADARGAETAIPPTPAKPEAWEENFVGTDARLANVEPETVVPKVDEVKPSPDAPVTTTVTAPEEKKTGLAGLTDDDYLTLGLHMLANAGPRKGTPLQDLLSNVGTAGIATLGARKEREKLAMEKAKEERAKQFQDIQGKYYGAMTKRFGEPSEEIRNQLYYQEHPELFKQHIAQEQVRNAVASRPKLLAALSQATLYGDEETAKEIREELRRQDAILSGGAAPTPTPTTAALPAGVKVTRIAP